MCIDGVDAGAGDDVAVGDSGGDREETGRDQGDCMRAGEPVLLLQPACTDPRGDSGPKSASGLLMSPVILFSCWVVVFDVLFDAFSSEFGPDS